MRGRERTRSSGAKGSVAVGDVGVSPAAAVVSACGSASDWSGVFTIKDVCWRQVVDQLKIDIWRKVILSDTYSHYIFFNDY